ncbi:hypothetical protein E6A50_02135, partial [Brachyspira hampsonii]|nr:hypothetical protein [Brachyspira hampsonii]
MIVDLKKYSLIDLPQIKSNIDSIKDMHLDIIIISEDGILSVVPCEQIEDVLSQLDESQYIKRVSIYVDKSLISIIGKQLAIDLNKQHADIHDINIFYSLYKNCKFETDKEYYDTHFNELISIRNIERIDYLK